MRAVIQRVTRAAVQVGNTMIARIGVGLCILIGIERTDSDHDIDYITRKCGDLRLFGDENGTMNLSAAELGLEFLIVSQFTLYGDARKGRRPSYFRAAPPDEALPIYERTCQRFRELYGKTAFGQFGADMKVAIENDGPVTILLDSRKEF